MIDVDTSLFQWIMIPAPGISRGMGRRSRPAGGGAGMRLMESGRGRKGTLDRRNLGLTGNWAQVEDGKGGNQMGEDRHILREELFWSAWHGREAQMIDGGQQMGAPYMWTVAPRQGKRG